jgi:hypothetical protein
VFNCSRTAPCTAPDDGSLKSAAVRVRESCACGHADEIVGPLKPTLKRSNARGARPPNTGGQLRGPQPSRLPSSVALK